MNAVRALTLIAFTAYLVAALLAFGAISLREPFGSVAGFIAVGLALQAVARLDR